MSQRADLFGNVHGKQGKTIMMIDEASLISDDLWQNILKYFEAAEKQLKQFEAAEKQSSSKFSDYVFNISPNINKYVYEVPPSLIGKKK